MNCSSLRHSLILIPILSLHASDDLNSGIKKHTYRLMICFRTGSNSFFVCFPLPYQLYSNRSWPSPNSSGYSFLVKFTAKCPKFLDSRKVFLKWESSSWNSSRMPCGGSIVASGWHFADGIVFTCKFPRRLYLLRQSLTAIPVRLFFCWKHRVFYSWCLQFAVVRALPSIGPEPGYYRHK